MSLVFKKYEREDSVELVDLGTLTAVIGAGGSIKFIRKNLADEKKRVCLVLQNKKGDSTTVNCSSAVSAIVRTALNNGAEKSAVLAGLAKLSLLENEEGIAFVSAPSDSSTEEFFAIDTIKKTNVSWDELVAF